MNQLPQNLKKNLKGSQAPGTRLERFLSHRVVLGIKPSLSRGKPSKCSPVCRPSLKSPRIVLSFNNHWMITL